MRPIEEFRAENDEIRDLCTILNLAIDEYDLRNNKIVCELIDRFVESVNAHLRHEDRSIYRDLLSQHTREADHIADHFLGNTQELKRIFKAYSRGWCRKTHAEQQHQKYVQESKEMFKLVCARIDFEETRIFPYFEKATA